MLLDKKAAVQDLIQRQEEIAKIEKALVQQDNFGKKAFSLLMKLAPLPKLGEVPADHTHASNVNITNGTATVNATGTDSFNASNRTQQQRQDPYAEARKMFAPSPTERIPSRIKEQEVDEYTMQRIRCYPTDEKGEVTRVTRSAAYCW